MYYRQKSCLRCVHVETDVVSRSTYRRWFHTAGVPGVRPEGARAKTRWRRDWIVQGLSKHVKGLAVYPGSSREIQNSFNWGSNMICLHLKRLLWSSKETREEAIVVEQVKMMGLGSDMFPVLKELIDTQTSLSARCRATSTEAQARIQQPLLK